jgi:hypothetical protein
VIQQLKTGPAMGSMADWMSAAVVPGAKLLPITTNGPELAPLMEMPTGPSRTVACPLAGCSAESKRFSSGRRLFGGFAVDCAGRVGADGARVFFFGLIEADAERYNPASEGRIS